MVDFERGFIRSRSKKNHEYKARARQSRRVNTNKLGSIDNDHFYSLEIN